MAIETGGSDDETLCQINVTPMVDVLMCLIIIFMISSSGPTNEKQPISIPKQAVVQTPGDPGATLLITVDRAGNAKLGEQVLSNDDAQLVQQLERNPKLQADGKVHVDADAKVQYGKVIRIFAAAHAAGIEQVGLASDRL